MDTTFEPGCYFDSHRGHYIIRDVIRFAEEQGRALTPDMDALVAAYDEYCHHPDYDYELVLEESDASIQWLNDHCAVDGHIWEWYEGDFGLYPLEDEF